LNKYKDSEIMHSVTAFSVIIIVTLLVTPTIGSITITLEESEENVVEFNGSIIGKLSEEYFGMVSPSINISEYQTLELNTTKTVNNTYLVDSVLKINVEVIGNIDKQYILGRYLIISIVIRRETENLSFYRASQELDLIEKILKSFSRTNLLSEDEKYIEIPLQYETSCRSENASVYIFAIGFPCRLLSLDEPGFVFKILDLKLIYDSSVIYDEIPPVTVCQLEGTIR